MVVVKWFPAPCFISVLFVVCCTSLPHTCITHVHPLNAHHTHTHARVHIHARTHTCTHTRHTHTHHSHTQLTLVHTHIHTHAQAKLAFERLEVEKKFHPFINGQAKALSDQTGTRINIPPPSVDRADITVAGEKEGVAKAVAAIKVLYEELVSTSGTRSADWRCTACTHV